MGDADVEFHRREYERLVADLETAHRASGLREVSTARAALDDLLIRLRTQGRMELPPPSKLAPHAGYDPVR